MLIFLYCEENPNKETSIKSFDKLKEWIEKGCFPNAEIKKTFFKKEDVVYLNYIKGFETFHFKVTESNFENIKVRINSTKINTFTSFDCLKSLLSADDFCEYLKDRGITKV